MRRETEALRAAAGRPGDADLEVLLAAAAAAWPDGQGPVQTLHFEGGHLTLAAAGWADPQIAQFREVAVQLRLAHVGEQVGHRLVAAVVGGAGERAVGLLARALGTGTQFGGELPAPVEDAVAQFLQLLGRQCHGGSPLRPA